jgi:phosphatidylserine/phosphatidylglycerophosphate/cardiolipin synthase-like enzyme
MWKRPALELYLLKSNLRLLPAFDGIWFGLTPVALLNQMSSKRMHFAIDGAHPIGAVHHQKIAVIDDAVAFCGGVDLTVDRWARRLEPTLRNVDVGIARTLPELEERREVREVEALNLAAIAAARHTIYLENQYLDLSGEPISGGPTPR